MAQVQPVPTLVQKILLHHLQILHAAYCYLAVLVLVKCVAGDVQFQFQLVMVGLFSIHVVIVASIVDVKVIASFGKHSHHFAQVSYEPMMICQEIQVIHRE